MEARHYGFELEGRSCDALILALSDAQDALTLAENDFV